MKTITCFCVELWDGGERHNFGFYLATKEEADKYKAIDKYCYIRPVTLTIYDTVEERNENTPEKLKARALAKLTVEERTALGYKG